jgi:aspartate/methionine/tyrosine aminotransferase
MHVTKGCDVRRLNPAASSLPRSGIRVILDEANRTGNVVHLEIGQPDFPTPAHIIEAAMSAASAGFTGYTPNAGYPSLREAFASRLWDDHALRVEPAQVVVTPGAAGALFSALCALVSPGDEVLVPNPGYPNYYMPVLLLGARAVPYPLDAAPGFALDPDAIADSITARTKAIIINSPSNPTGAIADAATWRKILDIASRQGIYVLSDECYDHILFEDRHTSPLKFDSPDGVIAIYSCSKTYSMTGWRVGFSVSSAELANTITHLQEMYVSCAPSVSQKAAEAALLGPQACVREMVQTYLRRRDLAVTLATQNGLQHTVPRGAFYMLVAIPGESRADSMHYSLRLVKEARVAVAPGATFGSLGEGYVRVSLCASESALIEGIPRLATFT